MADEPVTLGMLAEAVTAWRDARQELAGAERSASIFAPRLGDEADEAAAAVAELAGRYVDAHAGAAVDAGEHGGVVGCSSCGAPIVWRRHERTGNLAPIDVRTEPAGNVILLSGERYRVLSKADLAREAEPRTPRYMPHFATCPQALGWRGRARASR